ncbi:MAG: ATP-dependent RecD-like DNA helicase [Clostridiales bacterium]|nr:ATP-dependent RecD-like DNA helicase [Candidatus Cacconaster stercorequi]
MGERSTVMGTVQNIVFQNEENGYTVLCLLTEQGELVTVVGCIPCAAPGESMAVTGVWTNHPSYGQQLTAESVERRMPESEAEIAAYLASGIIKGIGPATAQRLVDRYGTDTLAVLEDEPERLQTIKGITAKRAMEISVAFRQLTGLRRVMEFLARYDLPVTMAMRLYRAYGADALPRLKDNPYLLADEAYGVAFSALDEIALSMGFEANSPCRTEAAILYELSYNLGNGHVFLPRDKLLAATAQLIGVPQDEVEITLDALLERKAVVQEHIAGVEGCYLRRMYEAETYVSAKLLAMRKNPFETAGSVSRIIAEIEKKRGITYAPQQKQAVEMAAREGVLLLTGGPGTGKTTTVQAIVTLLQRMGLEVLLLAPTGRAAKRMSELCGQEAQTIHRALGMNYNELTGEVTFRKNGKEPLEADAVIVDEMSMVDLELMRSLLTALRPGCRLVMVGDPDQLPSVGAGNVFADLRRSGVVPTVALKEIFRQAQQSAIIRNAYAVNGGQAPDLGGGQEDFFFLCRRSPERLVQTVVELVAQRLPQNMNIPAESIQVLSATRKGECGTANLNRALQSALNPPARGKQQKVWGDTVFREGDRVMQTKNNYDVIWEKDDGTVGTGIFNGDVGIIQEIDPSGELITIRFEDRISVYTVDLLSQLELAYAITVHKAQGSEYRAVVLVSAPAAPGLMVRGVLYTAITRARELLIVVGDDVVPGKMAANDRQQRRYSGLRRRLKQGGEAT